MHCSLALWALAIMVVLSHEGNAKIFKTSCELANELKRQGLIASDLPNWVCLVEAESSRNTAATSGTNDYGLFQIHAPLWCTKGKAGGGCNVKCEDLLNDNLADDVACARKVYASKNAFTPWYGWRNKCQGKPLPNLSKC